MVIWISHLLHKDGVPVFVTYSFMPMLVKLTRFKPMFHFYTPWNGQRFSGVFRGSLIHSILAWNGWNICRWLWKVSKYYRIASNFSMIENFKILWRSLAYIVSDIFQFETIGERLINLNLQILKPKCVLWIALLTELNVLGKLKNLEN